MKRPRYKSIVITGRNACAPKRCRARRNDWLCWINLTKDIYVVRFDLDNPLRDARGKDLSKGRTLRLKPWSASPLLRITANKRKVRKGDGRKYKAVSHRDRGGPPNGPIVIPED